MDNGKSSILLLDTSVFIEAHKRYYAWDICPGFWACLSHYYDEGFLKSIDKVKEEIKSIRDQLWDWVKDEAPQDMFVTTAEQAVRDNFSEIMEWVRNQNFNNNAQIKFAGGADGWLIAYARAHDMILITQEQKTEPNVKKSVPIPNVCEHFHVPYKDTFAMLRQLGVQFTWHDH